MRHPIAGLESGAPARTGRKLPDWSPARRQRTGVRRAGKGLESGAPAGVRRHQSGASVIGITSLLSA